MICEVKQSAYKCYFYITFTTPDHWFVPVSCSPAVNLLDSRSVIGDLGWVAYPKNGVSSTHLPVSQHSELRAGLGEHLKVSNSLDGRKDSFKVKNNRTWQVRHRERGSTRGQRQTEKKGKPFFFLKEAQRHTKPAVVISLWHSECNLFLSSQPIGKPTEQFVEF